MKGTSQSTKKAAIITAAGASRRMKRSDWGISEHKALLDWKGRSMVAHQVWCLHEAGFEPFVVTGADGDAVGAAVPKNGRIVHNSRWEEGRSKSIEVGAAALPDDLLAVMVVAVDQPVVPSILRRLAQYAGEPLVQPVDGQGRHGHPVILSGESVEELRRLRNQPEGLRSLVRRLRPSGRLVHIDGLPHWDLNDPEAYRRAVEGRAGP